MESYFDYLPIELVIIIFSYLRIQDKEHLTNAFPDYYSLFKDEKKKFIEENYLVNYKPLVKMGVKYFLKENALCINSMLRKKRFFIDCFPKALKTFFVNYDTPMIPYKKECESGQDRIQGTDIFRYDLKELKYPVSVGILPNKLKFIVLKRKDDEIVYIWEHSLYGKWMCHYNEMVLDVIDRFYVNFHILERIMTHM